MYVTAIMNIWKNNPPFQVENGQLFYKKTHARVIINADEQLHIIKMTHCGSDSSIEALRFLSSYKSYFWYHMSDDVRDFIMRCDSCQRVNSTSLKVFNQIGVDIMTLSEVDGFKYVVVGIDYFTKWSEARPIKDKSAVTVAWFLYDEIICRHGCPKIQISDQGREFVNKLNDELFRLTGTKHRHIIRKLQSVLQDNVLQWPYILQGVLPGVLFAHRTAQHSSTGYMPFKMLYQRDATVVYADCS
ncbi:hypothetical protein AGLY_017282, partial [Aphis glycines]